MENIASAIVCLVLTLLASGCLPRSEATLVDFVRRAQLMFERSSDRPNATKTNTIKRINHRLEAHNVTTDDGYILTLHRLPGRSGSVPVYLQHGLLESSVDWLLPGKGKSLAYILRDQGYDVWMGNARGNTLSKRHINLSTSDPEFWNFSWDELGLYDLPAAITYISSLTNDTLFYIGHSMGATTFSVMAIERPDVAQKIRAMIALAPATYVHNMKAPIRLFSRFWRSIQATMYRLRIYEIFPRGPFLNTFGGRVCNTNVLRDIFCSNSLFLIAGFSPAQLDSSLLSAIWNRFPAGTSTKLFIHWFQQMAVYKLRKFDYGFKGNQKAYNDFYPPEYDLSKIQVPVAVFWSENDLLVGDKDVEYFYNQIIFKLGSYKVDDAKFNHFDFLWGRDAPKLIYGKILQIMGDFNNQIDTY